MSNAEKIKGLKECLSMIRAVSDERVVAHNNVFSKDGKGVLSLVKGSLIMSVVSVFTFVISMVSALFFNSFAAGQIMFFSICSLFLCILTLSLAYNLHNKITEKKIDVGDYLNYDECFSYDLSDEDNKLLHKISLPKEVYMAIYQKIKDLVGEEDFKLNIEFVAGQTDGMSDIANAYFVKMVILETIAYLIEEDEDEDPEWDAMIEEVKNTSLNNLYASLK